MNIQTKLTIPIVGFFLVVAFTLHFYWVPKGYMAIQNAFKKTMHKEILVLENDLIRSLLTRDVSAIYASLNGFVKTNKTNIINLSLIDANNKHLYPLFKKHRETTDLKHLLIIKHNVLLEGERLGTLNLDVTWNDEYLEEKKRLTELEWLLLVSFFIFMGLIIIWQKKIIQSPIMRLEYAIHQMGKGDMYIHVPVETNDEIGCLAKNFKKMRTLIIEEHKALKSARLSAKNALLIIEEKNIILQHEIACRKEALAKLDDIAKHDDLTRLPNRLLLKIEAEKALATAKRFGYQVGFIFLDLDGFKAVNDNHNHEIGDSVLIEVSHRLIDAVRDIDTVARFGGDEFVIMLPNCQIQQDITLIAERVLSAISGPIEGVSIKERISASLGIAIYPDDATTFDELILLADKAMYQAKKEGKNQFFMASGLKKTKLE